MSTPRRQQEPKQGFLKDYRPVNQRIQEFYDKYPTGRIITNLVAALTDIETGVFVVRAELFRSHDNAEPFATGMAVETPTSGQVNRQGFALENAETSSIGRALQNAGIATKASDIRPEEMERLARVEAGAAEGEAGGGDQQRPASNAREERPCSSDQQGIIRDLGARLVAIGAYKDKKAAWEDAVSMTGKPKMDDWTEPEAAHLIRNWGELLRRKEENKRLAEQDDPVPI